MTRRRAHISVTGPNPSNHHSTLTLRLLQVYVFLVPMEELLAKLFGVDTAWKPYRVAAILVALVAMIELPLRRLDSYDKTFLSIFLTGCGLSFVWFIIGEPEPIYALRECALVLVPVSMYFCIKLSARTPKDLAGLILAFVLGALVDAGYACYEVFSMGQMYRPGGLSGAAPENLALHSGLAIAFVLFPYPGRSRTTWLSVLIRTIAGAVLCLGVVVSGTRAAWLGLVLSTTVLACVMAMSRSQRGMLLKVLIPAALLIIAYLAFNVGTSLNTGTGDLTNAIETRMEGEGLQTGTGRTEIWGQALDAAWDYNLFGGGFAGFMQATSKRTADYHTIKPLDYGMGPHNIFLEALIDYGPSSFILLLACLTTLVATLLRAARNAIEDLSAHRILYALLFLIVCGQFRGLFDVQDFWIILAFVTLFVRYHALRGPSRFCPHTPHKLSERPSIGHRMPSLA